MIKMTQFSIQKSISTDTQGLAKTAKILITAFEPQTRFLKQWSIEAECVGRNGQKNIEALYCNDDTVGKWSVAFLGKLHVWHDVYFLHDMVWFVCT